MLLFYILIIKKKYLKREKHFTGKLKFFTLTNSSIGIEFYSENKVDLFKEHQVLDILINKTLDKLSKETNVKCMLNNQMDTNK